MSKTMKTLYRFIPFAVCITLVFGCMYAIAQQVFRQTANDPQIQIAHDVASILDANVLPENAFPGGTVDLEKSMAPFGIIYDVNGTAITKTAFLDGKVPTPPQGVFTYAKTHGENRLTWEPKSGVREAIVVVPYTNTASSGFVLTGRSLRETEKRVSTLGVEILIGWLATLLATLLSLFIFSSSKQHE